MRVQGAFLFLLIASVCYSQDNVPYVQTRLGKIVGRYSVSHLGKVYESYEGIPYALPPTGDRRFEPPQPIIDWPSALEGIANKNKNKKCLQHLRNPVNKTGNVDNYVSGTEDCLYLYVSAPVRVNNETFPVIVWIHGGAFQYGAGYRFRAKYLIDYNVVLVTINYRLGVLGFLSTENEVVPGNMGLKDQVAALRWINENIHYFGGDNKKITLTGLSAGGASVHYHYLSPMSRGLFQSGISFSGTAFDCWTQIENSREKAFKMAEYIKCPTNSIQEMVKCFKSRPGRNLVEAEAKFMPWHLNPFTPFGPVVEKFSEKPFVDRSPIDIINSGDVQDLPWITGIVSEEGLYPVAEFALNEEVLKDLDENWDTIAPQLLDYYYTIPQSKHALVAQIIRQHYFGNDTINKNNVLALTHLVGDRLFSVDAQKAAVVQAKANRSPVWFYYYSYRAKDSISNGLSNSTENFGTCHGDDINLVLENEHMAPTNTDTDYAMHNDLIKFWITVARKQIPKFGPKWLKVNPDKPSLNYLHIEGPGMLKPKSSINLAERLFWESIDFDENREIIKEYLVYKRWQDEWKSSSVRQMACVTLIIACGVLHYVNIRSL